MSCLFRECLCLVCYPVDVCGGITLNRREGATKFRFIHTRKRVAVISFKGKLQHWGHESTASVNEKY